jgi:hypothetical protein
MGNNNGSLLLEAEDILPPTPQPPHEPFTDEELGDFLKELIHYVKTTSKSREISEARVYNSLQLPDYVTINSRSSDTGTVYPALYYSLSSTPLFDFKKKKSYTV